MWFYVRMNPFGKHFGKFARKETFFSEKAFFYAIVFNDFGLQAAISPT